MGVLSDFVSAPSDAGAAIGQSERPSNHWRVLEGWKGVDPIKLSTLHSLIASEPLDVDSIVAKSEEFQMAGGNESDGPWVMSFPDRITHDFALLESERIDALAHEWSKTEELVLDRFTQSDAAQFVADLSSFCKTSLQVGNRVYVRISI